LYEISIKYLFKKNKLLSISSISPSSIVYFIFLDKNIVDIVFSSDLPIIISFGRYFSNSEKNKSIPIIEFSKEKYSLFCDINSKKKCFNLLFYNR
jgi:hypothetical protein